MLVQDRVREELLRIVRVNHEICTVMSVAFQTSLMATNALIMAARAGERARGFAVLSQEIRRFTRDLERHMAAIKNINDTAVSTVCTLLKQQELSTVFARASAGIVTQENHALLAWLDQKTASYADAMATTRSKLQALTDTLTRTLMEVSGLIETGVVLAQTANIEAVYGGDHAAELSQVAHSFGVTVKHIAELVGRLGREAQRTRRIEAAA